VTIGLAAVGALVAIGYARRWERAGTPERYVALLVVVLLVESLVYTSQPDTPVGLFRIPLFGGNVRTQDLLVVAGVVGRMTVRPLPRRISTAGVLWFLAGAWFAVATVRGVMAGHDMNLVLFSAASLVGLFGSILLVAGCDVSRLIDMARSRWIVVLGAIVLVIAPNEASPEPVSLFGTELGTIHSDTASVFVALGTFAILVEWSATTRRRWAAWAALPLLATPFTIAQRATLLQLAGTLLVVGWAMTQPEWRDRFHVARLKLVKGVLAVVALSAVALIFHLRDTDASVPFSGYYEQTFTAPAQQQSAQAREESFGVAIDEWTSAWPFGSGLGHTYRIVRPFGSGLAQPATFDNVPLDVLVRTGLVGFVLTAGALLWTMRDGLRTWRRHADGSIAAFALAGVAVLAGLLTKAVFESVLEKGKIAVVIGLTVGGIAAAARSLSPPAPPIRTRPRPAAAALRPTARLRHRSRAHQGETTWT
jgi:hypothetical protein